MANIQDISHKIAYQHRDIKGGVRGIYLSILKDPRIQETKSRKVDGL